MYERRLEELAVEQKVGQLFVVGFQQPHASGPIRELVSEYHVGGVVYFDRNVESAEQTAELSATLQSLAREATGIPLLVATDQEGGTVSRIPFGTTPPGGMAVGATEDPALAADLAGAVGTQLRSVGVNLNLAPVLDVNSDPDNPVIGNRSYGSDPELVAEMGTAAAAALQDRGVAACAKHFPGHGDTAVDSHHALPVVDHGRERLDRVELRPFRAGIEAGVDAVMTAHVDFPAIEPDEGVPATLSRAVLTGLLREELGHEGLVVTDCMEMNAIADGVGTVEGAVRAIRAGADVVLVSHTPSLQTAAIEAVVDAVEAGELPEERVDDAARRVLRLKDARVDPGSPPAVDDARERVVEASRGVARAAVTLHRDDADRLPIDADGVFVWEYETGGGSPAEDAGGYADAVAELLAARGYAVRRHAFGDDPERPPVRDDEVVLVLADDAVAHDVQPSTVRRSLDDNLPVVVLAVVSPYDLRAFPAAPTVLTTYDDSRPMLEAAADVLAGRRAARGTLPVTLP